MTISLNPSTILSGQGIDVSSLVTQILNSKSGALSVWQAQQTTLATQNGLLAGMENNLINLQSSVNALASHTGALTAQSAISSDYSILTATAQSSAVNGTHQIVVTNLATNGTLYTNSIAAGPDVSFLPSGATGGDLKLQVGSTIRDIAITAGSNDTLNKLASSINAQSSAGSWGVTASVVTDTNGSRLALQSQNSGTAGALSLAGNTTSGTLYTADLADGNTSILANGDQTGDFQLQVGGSSGTTVDIQITAGSNDTLNTLADSINTQSAANSWGLTASVVADNGGTHLAIASSAAGAAGAITVTNNTTVLTAANPATKLTFAAPVGGTNASLTIDGVPFSSASNTVSGAILGVTLNIANQTTGNPATLTVGPDAGQMTSAISDFISAYNTVISTINTQYVLDPTGSIPAPPLEADLSLRSVQSSVLADAAYAVGGNSGLVNLAAMGINMNNDGTLTMGLNAAGQSFAQVVASNPAAVRNFFQNDSATGFADNFKTDLFNLTSYTQGPLNVALTQNQAEQQDLTNTITDFQDRLAAQKTQLTNTYNSVNSSLQSYPLLLQLITETLGSMSSNFGSSTSSNTHPTLTSGL